MLRRFVLLASAVAAAACSADTATQEPSVQPQEAPSVALAHDRPADASLLPEDPADRRVRRDLNLAIAQDRELKDRQISFMVSHGDVNVSGVVRSEDERRKINELAMRIEGVKSVANALRVGE